MTKTFNTFVFIFMVSSSLSAQNKDSTIQDIRVHYNYIRTNLSSFDTTMIDIWDESAEGGQGIAYYENTKLKLIEVVWFGETGKRISQYYYNMGKLIFAFDQVFTYNRPIYWDEKNTTENEDKEVFDSEKTIVKENRFYFDKEVLFLWLDDQKKEVDLTVETNSVVGKELVTHSNKMKADLKK